jgi:hypothetical protein
MRSSWLVIHRLDDLIEVIAGMLPVVLGQVMRGRGRKEEENGPAE